MNLRKKRKKDLCFCKAKVDVLETAISAHLPIGAATPSPIAACRGSSEVWSWWARIPRAVRLGVEKFARNYAIEKLDDVVRLVEAGVHAFGE
jgi:hypothetical protein